jgi:hypothetical protein
LDHPVVLHCWDFEKVDLAWYAKKVSVGPTLGYFAGIAALSHYAVVHGGMIGNFLAQQVIAADIVQHSATVPM